MKEYLEKQADGSYKLVMRGIVGRDDDIEIPDGAEAFGYTGIVQTFYKDDFRSFFNENTDGQWDERSETWIGRKQPVILWQRHTQPEDLPFMDSLNDQYAEIEQVRQQTIEATLAERQAQYGCFEDVARTTGKIMEAISEVRVNGLNDLPYPHCMALYMIASKMARIVNGDFNSIDGWHDISGYATLVERLIDG